MEAWRSKRFVTYPNLPDWTKNEWSLLLSDDWRTLLGSPLVDVATHQWLNANISIMSGLNKVTADRVLSVNYQDLISSPDETLDKIFELAKINARETNNNKMLRQMVQNNRDVAVKWLKEYELL
jgi:hypothetical protein